MRVPLTLNLHPSARTQPRAAEPLTFGVPFPAGRVHEAGPWLVVGGASPAPACARVLDRWPDGSIRWASVDTQLDVDGNASPPYFIELEPAALVPTPAFDVRISPDDRTCTVETAGLKFIVAAGSSIRSCE